RDINSLFSAENMMFHLSSFAYGIGINAKEFNADDAPAREYARYMRQSPHAANATGEKGLKKRVVCNY
ncbi:MAG: hypothetical protein U9R40_04980, partial [Synergistota bacterium]|nr:hypothetical protein [Synergistota bacterium]